MVHPDRPHAGQRRVDTRSPQSRRRARAAAGARRPRARPAGRGTPCARCRRGRGSPARPPGRGGAAGSSCGRPAWRSRSRGRARGSPRRCPVRRSCSARTVSSAHTSPATSSYTRLGLHVRGCAPRQCMATNGHPGVGQRPRRHLGVGQAAADVVDDRGPGLRRPGRPPRRAWCRPRPTHPARASSLDDGQHPAQLLLHGRPLGAGPGRTRRRRRGGRRPAASRSRPWATAASGSNHSPPSLKESGVTLTTPITQRQPVSCARSPSAPSEPAQPRAR